MVPKPLFVEFESAIIRVGEIARIPMRLCRKLGSTLISVTMTDAEGMRHPKSMNGLTFRTLLGGLAKGPVSHSDLDNVIIDSEAVDSDSDRRTQSVIAKMFSIKYWCT